MQDRITSYNVCYTKLLREATLHTSGADLFADAASGVLYAAIDALIDKLDRQIVKHKEKLTKRHHRG